ncbi:hypothetical protein N8444_04065 [Pelagibacteraceae bacterium]|nr:hypothetical protein [Pelagibacteraceae bacterium]
MQKKRGQDTSELLNAVNEIYKTNLKTSGIQTTPKKKTLDTNKLLAAVNEIYQSNPKKSGPPNITEDQKNIIKKYTLANINHLVGNLVKKIRLEAL